jgi:UDP-2,3-diacylglucosamine pyrophosphatase LpxH
VIAERSSGNSHWLAQVERSTIGRAFSSGTTGKSYRSIWISDLHLGTRACKAETLLDFLRHHQAENLYLVGDIIDGWNIGPSWYWSPAQNAVVAEIASWQRHGAHVVFLPGNHDEPHTDLVRSMFGPVQIVSELVHRTAEGCRMLVIHGHQFDGSLSSAAWLSRMGSRAYTLALRIDQWHSAINRNLVSGRFLGASNARVRARFSISPELTWMSGRCSSVPVSTKPTV